MATPRAGLGGSGQARQGSGAERSPSPTSKPHGLTTTERPPSASLTHAHPPPTQCTRPPMSKESSVWRGHRKDRKQHLGDMGSQPGRKLQNSLGGPPWWHSGSESACQCRGHGFNSWSWKIPRAVEPLSPGAASTEPTLEGSVLCNKRSPRNQKPVRHDYRAAPTHPKERKP